MWKCPVCDRLRRTPGDVTSVRCHRSKCNHEWMRLQDADHPWPTGLQIDLSERQEATTEPEAHALAPRSDISMDEAIDAVTGGARRQPSTKPSEDEPTSTIDGPSVDPSESEPTPETVASVGDASAESTGESDAPSPGNEALPPKKKRRGRRRGRRGKPGDGPAPTS